MLHSGKGLLALVVIGPRCIVHTYKWLKTPRYAYGQLFKLPITYKWLQVYL